MGRPINVGHEEMLVDAGFEDVRANVEKWPTSLWAQDCKHYRLGAWTELTLCRELETVPMALLSRGLGWDWRGVWLLCALVRAEMKNREMHAYFRFITLYGRKPSKSVC